MQHLHRWFARTLAAAGLASLAFSAGASPALSAASNALGGASALASGNVVVETVDINISGIDSNDPFGAAINVRLSTPLPANARITGIGWSTNQFADSPSWLSEMVMSFESSSGPVVFLTPGIGDDFPGTASYSSGGVVDLVGLGLDFSLDADGLLTMEFFEDFDDFPNDWDGFYMSGSIITVRYEFERADVPEPVSLALAGVALLGLVGSRRLRRRA